MGEVVNLNKYRKVRQRLDDEKLAIENRAKFGRAKREREQARDQAEREHEDLEDKRLE
ncbi:MAG: DUF4169 family protein [Geminicoccales bacterium]